MLIRSTSAIASANNEVVCSKVYQKHTKSVSIIGQVGTYHALFSALLAICALDIEDKQGASFISIEPDAFCGLLATLRFIHDLKCSVKEQIK